MKKPLCIDLYCGLGGWAEGFLAEGYRVIGYDIERHDYGTGGYPGKLRLRDVLKIHGREFKDAAVIVASPPCQRYSYMAMPWSKAKALIRWYEEKPERVQELNALFDACFRIQREASEAAGRHIPLIVENVRGAQRWVGQAKWHYGSFFLWGDLPALMPVTFSRKTPVGSWDKTRANYNGDHSWRPEGEKVGRNFHYPEKYGIPSPSFHGAAHEKSVQRGDALKVASQIDIRNGHDHTRRLTNPAEHAKVPGIDFNGHGQPDYKPQGFNVTAAQRFREGVKQRGISGKRSNGKGDRWFQDGAAQHGSKSNSRKAASAMIAKIPFPLAQHIARSFKPEVRA